MSTHSPADEPRERLHVQWKQIVINGTINEAAELIMQHDLAYSPYTGVREDLVRAIVKRPRADFLSFNAVGLVPYLPEECADSSAIATALLTDWLDDYIARPTTGFENSRRNGAVITAAILIGGGRALAFATHPDMNFSHRTAVILGNGRVEPNQLPFPFDEISFTDKGPEYWARQGFGSTSPDPNHIQERERILNFADILRDRLFPVSLGRWEDLKEIEV